MSDNYAKQIVLEEAGHLAKSLQNGKSGDPETQGRAIGLLVKMITPLYEADFVTKQECLLSHDVLVKQMKSLQKTETKKVNLKAGPLQFEGAITPLIAVLAIAGIAIAGMIYLITHLNGVVK